MVGRQGGRYELGTDLVEFYFFHHFFFIHDVFVAVFDQFPAQVNQLLTGAVIIRSKTVGSNEYFHKFISFL